MKHQPSTSTSIPKNNMSLILPDEYKNENPFKLPFRADANCIVDADNRGVACVSDQASPQEAVRIAKLFASSADSLAVLSEVAEVLTRAAAHDESSLHGTPEEDKSNCMICQIDKYINSVIGEPK